MLALPCHSRLHDPVNFDHVVVDKLRESTASFMGTMILTGTGSADSTGKVITYQSIYDDPAAGEKNKKMRQVLCVVSNDELGFEMYDSQQGFDKS